MKNFKLKIDYIDIKNNKSIIISLFDNFNIYV